VAFYLAENGFNVTVLTGYPNYAGGRLYPGYGFFSKYEKNINGVRIVRVPVIPRRNGTGARLFLNYYSYVISASVKAFFISFSKKYDIILVNGTSPIMQCYPAIIVRMIQRIPLFFWVLDLWPESLVSAGRIKNKTVIRHYERVVKFIYNHTDKILIGSMGFEKSIAEKGDYKSKIVYFPNWAESIFTNIRQKHPIPSVPEGFLIMFAGNLGEAQDLEAIMNSALILKDNQNIKWIFLGNGRRFKWIENFIKSNNLQNTVFLFGSYPIETMPDFFEKADVMLVTLKDELIFNLTVPAKIQAYMASSKPIIGMINGEGARLIDEADCGLVANSGDSEGLSECVLKMCQMTKEQREILGSNGYNFYIKHFDKENRLKSLISLIKASVNR